MQASLAKDQVKERDGAVDKGIECVGLVAGVGLGVGGGGMM